MDQTARVSSQKTVRYLQLLTYMFFPIELCDDINEAFFNDFLPKWWLDVHNIFPGKNTRTFGKISPPPAKEIWQI